MNADYAISDRRLWENVIIQAIADATSTGATSADKLERTRSREWFQNAGPDFRDVCELAGLDPERIRREAIKLFAGTEAPTHRAFKRRLGKRRSAGGGRAPSVFIEHGGERLTLNEWSRRLGISRATLDSRYRAGLSAEDILAPSQGRGGRRTGRGVGRAQTVNAGTGALPAAKTSAELGFFQ